MHKNVIEWLRDLVTYTKPTAGLGIVTDLVKYTSWEPSMRVPSGNGSMTLELCGRTYTFQMPSLYGYHTGMAVSVTFRHARKTGEVQILEIGAPCDS